MPSVSNKTPKPLTISLPGGKTLRLGPGKTGEVTGKAVESPAFRKLIEAGEIEVTDEGTRRTGTPGGGKRGGGALHGHSAGGGMRRSGDR